MGTRKLLGNDGSIHSLNSGDGFTGVYICKNLANYIKFVSFTVSQLYLNKAV